MAGDVPSKHQDSCIAKMFLTRNFLNFEPHPELQQLLQDDFWHMAKPRMGKDKSAKQYKAIAREAATEYLICLGVDV